MHFTFDNSYSQLPNSLFEPTLPTPVANPSLLLFNKGFAKEIGVEFNAEEADLIAQQLAGNKLINGSYPIAQAYAGHQFGHFAMLGDGRAILLGEIICPDKERLDLQLKGAGQTAFSRRGDGRATLRSMLREYLMSEVMNSYEIPTSRSLAVVTTGEPVYRENVHEGGVLTRIAASHIRVGTFEYVRHFEQTETLQTFTNYVIQRHYPELMQHPNPPLALLEAVMDKQIDLVVNWMRVGFIHGVMNTDNISIAGETFDFGPCAFMNSYRLGTVFSSIDTQGRYAYGNQPKILQWNLGCLAGALLPLIHSEEAEAIKLATEVVVAFKEKYEKKWFAMMATKLGIVEKELTDEIKELINDLLQWMELQKSDYTNTFLVLMNLLQEPSAIYESSEFIAWKERWLTALEENGIAYNEATAIMQKNNPVFIPRNHQVEAALDGITLEKDFTIWNKLLRAIIESREINEDTKWLLASPSEETEKSYRTFCGT